MTRLKFSISILLSSIVYSLTAQEIIADKIVGVVGQTAILYSDVEEQYMQMKAQAQGKQIPDRCSIFEDLLVQKLLVTQAGIDSIEVTDEEIEMELDQRLTYFINQIGTEQKLVEYFGKSIIEIKEDMREAVREQALTQKMQAEIVRDISITPEEVKEFYNGLGKDSIPVVESELQVSQIVLYPASSKDAIYGVKEKLLKLRERVLNGESFSTMAVLYSEGPSASKGGDIGWMSKSDLDPAYTRAALSLKKGQVSKIVETSFGFHIIQLIDKSDDRFKTRHILMKPKISVDEKIKAQKRLDSIAKKIRLDSISFEKAALYYSQEEDTRMSGGMKVNPMTLSNRFKVSDFPTSEYYIIRKLDVGEISAPFESEDDKGKTVFKIVQLKSKTKPHKANLKNDFDLIKNLALQHKQGKLLEDWISDKADDLYIRIEAPYKDCTFRQSNWKR